MNLKTVQKRLVLLISITHTFLNLEDVSRGLGFTEIKNEKEYIRWRTVEGYLKEFGFSQQVAKENFIPENIFYKLCFKASNQKAREFQDKVTDEILPSIRKYGAYATEATLEKMISDPQTTIAILSALKEEQDKRRELEALNAEQTAKIEILQPKASYYDTVLQSVDPVPITVIAKDYGKAAPWLNVKLRELGVQYKQGGVWLLYQKYAGKGYTKSKTYSYTDRIGINRSSVHTYWTQAGRKFLYDLLKENGIYPLMDMRQKVS